MEGYGNENPGAFQPTRPLRGATSAQCLSGMAWKLFQPTRPLRGATGFDLVPVLIQPISTHAPLAGRDLTSASTNRVQLTDFNPRAPCGARPPAPEGPAQNITISTHAPLAGRDFWLRCYAAGRLHFNPRAPCGARQLFSPIPSFLSIFQPTRPLRGATAKVYKSLCTFLR